MDNIMKKETLKKMHDVELEIMDEFVRICKKHKLQYFLIAGSLIGAVRHQGFIPWDDDLDVAMPRKDYEKFLNIAKNELNEKYFIDNFYNNKQYYLNFTKLRKKNTLFVQDFQLNYNGPKEIWIDILPLDNWCDEKKTIQTLIVKFIKFLRSLAHYRNGFFLGKNKLLIKKFLGLLLKPINSAKLMKLANFLMKIYNNKDSEYFINIASQYNYKLQTVKKDVYLPAKELSFEGRKYFVPGNYDYLLKRIYGDYMKLPPVEKRITHNPVELSFDVEKIVDR